MDPNESELTHEPFLTNTFGDHYLYSVNHNLLNRFGAEEVHRSLFKGLIESKDSLYIVIGTDSGTLPNYLMQQAIGSGTQFLLVELPEILAKINSRQPTQALPKNITVTTLDEFSTALEKVHLQSYLYIDNVHIKQSVGADYGFLPQYHDLFHTVKEHLEEINWRIRSTLGNQPFTITQLTNLADNIHNSNCLQASFPGKTAVLLAGGPSLDEILPWVIQHREQLVVLAVSRISRRLQQLDISPDIFLSIDPHDVSFDVSKEMLGLWENSLFVHQYHVSPKLLGQWRGRSLFLGQRFPWKSELNDDAIATPGPTVSNVALALATAMQFKQVILAGVDLCHSKSGYTHALGSNEHIAGPQLAKNCSQVQTNGGWFAETTTDLAIGIDILAQQALDASRQNVTFINPAEGAARVDNVLHLPLQEIQPSPLSTPAQNTISSLLPKNGPEERKRYFRQALQELQRARGELQKIKKLAGEALNCNDHLFGRKGKKQDFKYKKRMDKIERKLNKTHATFSYFTKAFGIRNFLKITRINKEDDWEDQEIEQNAITYYKAYKTTATQLLTILRHSKERILSRQAEDLDMNNLEALAEQWQKDGQPGRIFIWLDKQNLNSHEDLPVELQSIASGLIHSFNQVLAARETPHLARSKKFSDLHGVVGKALMFYQKKDLEALKQLVLSLEHHPQAEAQHYYHFTRGLLAEQQDNTEEALEQYQELFDSEEELLLEAALKQIASITLANQDIENALLALQNLSTISASYLPQYADLLRLTNAHQDAITAYLDYLEVAPQDISRMLLIGQYYLQLQIVDGAQAMFEHVLKIEPENKSAIRLLNSLTDARNS